MEGDNAYFPPLATPVDNTVVDPIHVLIHLITTGHESQVSTIGSLNNATKQEQTIHHHRDRTKPFNSSYILNTASVPMLSQASEEFQDK